MCCIKKCLKHPWNCKIKAIYYTWLFREIKTLYYKQLIENNKPNLKNQWAIIKQLIGSHNNINRIIITLKQYSTEVVNIFTKFFCTIVSDLRPKIELIKQNACLIKTHKRCSKGQENLYRL